MTWVEIFSDEFTDTDGTSLAAHDATWLERFGAPVVRGNAFSDDNSSNGSRAEIDLATTDDQAIEIVAGSVNQSALLIVRHTHDSDNDFGFTGYGLSLSAGFAAALGRYDGGEFAAATLDSAFQFPLYAPGDTIRLEAEGTTIRALLNGDEILSGTDATYSSGTMAAIAYTTENLIDSVVAYSAVELVAGPYEIEAAWFYRAGAEAAGYFN